MKFKHGELTIKGTGWIYLLLLVTFFNITNRIIDFILGW